MLHTALKNLLAHKLRLLTTALAVTLGVFGVIVHRVLGLDDGGFHVSKPTSGVVRGCGVGFVLVDYRASLIKRCLRTCALPRI